VTTRISNPFPYFTDRTGLPLDGGSIYIGLAGADPEVSPITVYLDQALTETAPQPITVIGGFPTQDGNPAFFYASTDDFSLRVRDRDGAEVAYVGHAKSETTAYQPLDSDLSAVAALTTTAFGRGVLTIADAAALRSYAGIVTPPNPTESLILAISDETTALTSGPNKLTFRMPYGFNVTEVRASLTTAQTSGSILTVDVNENGTSILSTKLTIDNGEKTSTTALGAPAVVDATLANDAEITIDIDQVGDGTAKGLKVTLIGSRS
jgi:hypothetical protein